MSTTGTAEAGPVGKQHAIIDMKQTFFRPVLISYSAACRYQSRCPVLEEARRHSKRGDQRPLDYLHFKLRKPISKDDVKSKNHRRGWWKSALAFWRRRAARGPYAHRAAVSGPLYTTESGGVGRRTCRPISGRLTATEFGAEEAGLAYLSLRELNQVDSRFVGLCFLVLHLSAKARFPASNRKGEGFRRQKERQKSDGMHADGRPALNRSGELRQSYVRRASPSAFRVGARCWLQFWMDLFPWPLMPCLLP
ncbi:hypothetical protein GW17_00010611 [Ensete ventricosum]|nr:hypothetical protein GW17_00010611 [Ensete ventricosum]